MARPQPLFPVEETDSIWFNPLPMPQHVDVFIENNPRPMRYVVPPHAEKPIPSRYDMAIQRVLCTEEDCRAKMPGWCTKGHPGTVMGGLAPQLQKRGTKDVVLADALDPERQAKIVAEAEATTAAMLKKQHEEAVLIAEAAKIKAEEALAQREHAKKK